jgi:pilus assembly protein Flp/PilA
MHAFFSAIQHFARDDDGITAIEYGLIAAVMAAMIGVAVAALAGSTDTTGLKGVFNAIVTQLDAAI